MAQLSILIPSRNEAYLQRTIEDIFEHSTADTEVIAGLDGYLPSLKKYPRFSFVYERESIGQRAITNALARLSKAEYVMKIDAHVSFSRGFDTALLKEMQEKTILAPLLMPLDGNTWTINGKKQMAQFVFDTNLVMQHAQGEAGETMCLQGSAWMVSRKDYWDWNLGDETLPSWGGQATELGIKAFLNGGVCRTTDKAYYGHVFRHADSDFPYDRGEDPGKAALVELRKRYLNKSIAPLIKRFGLPSDWTIEKVDNLLDKVA